MTAAAMKSASLSAWAQTFLSLARGAEATGNAAAAAAHRADAARLLAKSVALLVAR